MITDEIFNDELLQQAATELATALSNSLPPTIECQHKFFDGFEEKMQALIRDMGTKYHTVTIQDSVIRK